MNNKILFIATHLDDETLGCAGTILKHKAEGDKIYLLLATTIRAGKDFNKKAVSDRKNKIQQISKIYAFDKIYQLRILTTKIDKIPIYKIVNKISRILNEVKPATVYLPFRSDIHSDHRIIFDAAYSCTKVFRYPFVKKILMMETVSETEFAPALKECVFVPNYFVDISNFINKKLEILEIYKTELGKHPFPRSLKNIKSLAASRGVMSGCEYAESFMLLKDLW